jgi:hypothetical protein
MRAGHLLKRPIVTKFELTRGQLRAMMMISIITGESLEEPATR